MKIHGTAKGGALSTKDFGVAFGGAAAETIIYEQLTSSSNMYNFESGNKSGGMYISGSDSLIGEEINKTTFSLSKTGTPPQATLYCRVFNTASALTVKHTFGSLATSELTGTTTAYAFESASTYTIVANDIIAIYCENSGATYPDNMVLQGGTSGAPVTKRYADYNTSWSYNGNQLAYIILAKVG